MRQIPLLRRVVAAGVAVLTAGALAAPTAAAASDQSQTTTGDPSSKITTELTKPDGTKAETVENRWFVQLSSPAVAAGGSRATIETEQTDLANAIKDAGIDARVTTEYETLWNGVALSVSDADVDDLAELDQVVAIKPVVAIPRPGVDTDDSRTDEEKNEGVGSPQMAHALGMTGADVVHSKLGFTGSGVRIGIIDTGVDYDHVEFGGTGTPGAEAPGADGSTGFPTSKVVAGYDFVGNAYGDPDIADQTARYTPVPDAYPDDCSGHGTHVAGIAAAKGTPGTKQVTGVAPDAQLGAYRVFGCAGQTSAEIMTAAMERAADDGMDVVNMSIGADFMVFKDYPTAVAAESLAAKGVIVTTSQGNTGETGRWSMSAPASAEHVLAVGSVDNTVETNFYMTVSTNPGQKYLYAEAEGAGAAIIRDNAATHPLVAAGDPAADDGDEESDASLLCTAPTPGTYSGKTVLIRRGACPLRQKVLSAQAGGAAAVVMDNNQPGLFTAVLYGDGDPITIPVVTVSQEDGDAIRGALAADSTLTYTENIGEFNRPTAGLVSGFSAWGLNDVLQAKPDVVAPGGKIWSTWPIDHGGPYLTAEGTSMAAPYAAGIAALIVQAHPEIKDASGHDAFAQIAWRLRSTATPVIWTEAGGDASLLEPAARQGAGLIDADAAVLASVQPSSSVLSIGRYDKHPDGYQSSVTLTNHGDSPVTYALSHQDAVTVTGASEAPQRGTASPSTVSTDGQSVTVSAGGTATLDVTITAPEGIADGDFFGGWIVLTPAGAKPVRIPFQGVGGNLARAGVIGERTHLGNLKGEAVDPASYVYGDSTLTTLGAYEDLPVVLIDTAIPYRGSTMEVSRVNADGTTESLGQVASNPSPYTRADQPVFVWDGSYIDAADGDKVLQAPTGQYQITVYALPVGGEEGVSEDWASWTSPTFSLDWKTDGYIPQSRLTVTSPDGAGGDAAALSDDNIFSVAEGPATASYDIDLGGVYDVGKVHWTPQQREKAGHATQWTVQTSLDGTTWSDAGAADIDPATFNPAILELGTAVRARYVRVSLVNGQDGATSLQSAELRVAGSAVDPTPSPSGSAAPNDPSAPADPSQPTAPQDPGSGSTDAAGGAAPGGGGAPGFLARTGASVGIGLVGLGLVAAGAVLLVRRRRGAEDEGDAPDSAAEEE